MEYLLLQMLNGVQLGLLMFLDAFLDQRARFGRRSFAVDRTMLDVAVMHLARLVGETLADIVGVLDDMIAQLLELGAQLALLRHQQRGRS